MHVFCVPHVLKGTSRHVQMPPPAQSLSDVHWS
jgi:hypothetical protein